MAFSHLDYHDLRVAWIGDGNNVLRSWVHAAQVLGFQLRIASPAGYALRRIQICTEFNQHWSCDLLHGPEEGSRIGACRHDGRLGEYGSRAGTSAET